mgnify:FL=1
MNVIQRLLTTAVGVAVLLLAVPVQAFTAAAVTDLFNGVRIYTLCDAEGPSETGVCDDAASVDIAARVTGFTHLTFDSSQSTGTTYRCDIYAGNDSVSDTADLSTVGAQINSVSLSSTTEMIQFDGTFAFVWISCSAGADNTDTVTVKVQAAP